MINVKGTIFSTLKRAFDRLRLYADNRPDLMKKILFLIVLDDIFDWSDYLDEKQSVQKRLQELRTNFILCNPEFDICRFAKCDNYVNVNTPQTGDTWKRIWDEQPENLVVIEDPVYPDIPTGQEWQEDPSCIVELVYFGGEQDIIKKNLVTGAPLLNVNNLTVCEKMNLYIDRTTGTFWYVDTDGSWKQIENQGLTEGDVINLIRTHRGKVNRTWNETDHQIELEILPDNQEANSNLELLTLNDVEEMV